MTNDIIERDYNGRSRPGKLGNIAMNKIFANIEDIFFMEKKAKIVVYMDNKKHWAITISYRDEHGTGKANFDCFTGEYLGEDI